MRAAMEASLLCRVGCKICSAYCLKCCCLSLMSERSGFFPPPIRCSSCSTSNSRGWCVSTARSSTWCFTGSSAGTTSAAAFSPRVMSPAWHTLCPGSAVKQLIFFLWFRLTRVIKVLCFMFGGNANRWYSGIVVHIHILTDTHLWYEEVQLTTSNHWIKFASTKQIFERNKNTFKP